MPELAMFDVLTSDELRNLIAALDRAITHPNQDYDDTAIELHGLWQEAFDALVSKLRAALYEAK